MKIPRLKNKALLCQIYQCKMIWIPLAFFFQDIHKQFSCPQIVEGRINESGVCNCLLRHICPTFQTEEAKTNQTPPFLVKSDITNHLLCFFPRPQS
mmetsp:Transcript_40366/g.121631  ORF Transcript_40366/g.121631 Transcript_40366/m.121631 type:complete len:96 (-) Transcript_40366:790-1077(-)